MTNLYKTELREIEMEAAIYEAVADPDHPMLANTKILLSIVQDLQRQNDELTTVAADCRAAAGWGTPNDPMSVQSWAALGDPAEVPTFIRERFQDLQRQVAELEADKAELEADAKRIAFLFSGIRTTSNALVELELRLINGETPSLDAVRSAIDDAMMAALNTETTG